MGRKNDILIDQFIENGNPKTKKVFSESTITGYRLDLEYFCFWLNDKYNVSFKSLTEDHINEYLEELKIDNLTSKTLARKYSTIQSFLKFQGKGNLMNAVNIPKQNTIESKTTLLTQKEIKKILRRLERRELKADGTMRLSGFCYRAIINMMVYCPMRGSEILELKKEHFKIIGEHSTITCMNPKSGLQREVYIPKDVTEKIIAYLNKRIEEGYDSELLFTSRSNKPIVNRTLLSMLSSIAEECKIDNLTSRSFKNAYLYNASKENTLHQDLKKIKKDFEFAVHCF